jgi:hypothetical protein
MPESILEELPDDEIDRVHKNARELARETTYDELKTAITTWATGIEQRQGEKITDEEKKKMTPLSTSEDLLEGTYELQNAYDPRL